MPASRSPWAASRCAAGPATSSRSQRGHRNHPDVLRRSTKYIRRASRHVDAFRPYADAGFDGIYIAQIGGAHQERQRQRFLPLLSGRSTAPAARTRSLIGCVVRARFRVHPGYGYHKTTRDRPAQREEGAAGRPKQALDRQHAEIDEIRPGQTRRRRRATPAHRILHAQDPCRAVRNGEAPRPAGPFPHGTRRTGPRAEPEVARASRTWCNPREGETVITGPIGAHPRMRPPRRAGRYAPRGTPGRPRRAGARSSREMRPAGRPAHRRRACR
jgi:hypothetical protein